MGPGEAPVACGHAEDHRRDSRPAGAPAGPVADSRVTGQPGTEREGRVSLDAGRQGNRSVQVEGVPDTGEWPDLTEPGHLADAHPAGPDRDRRGQRQDQQRPRSDGRPSMWDRGRPVRAFIQRGFVQRSGLVRGGRSPQRSVGQIIVPRDLVIDPST